ncbi:MAG: flavodoxin family protein [Calditrichaeota bacterium]|nr:MAG: flavodoxin family protein [Calditrichota bacterium]MBL1204885.1 flavodoxin family protein [Calditrichota bacterium]NOG44714.1 flavodoxin family protein [Calditrichota bacterium]
MNKLIKIGIFLLLFLYQLPAQDSTNVLIVYFSKTGNTKSMAKHVAQGAKKIENVHVKVVSVEKAKTSDLLKADAIILGSPVYNANVAPEMQSFINNWPFKGSPLKDKIGAAFVSGGGISAGEELTQLNLLHSMLVFGMVVVGGDSWRSAFGASAITSEELFKAKNNDSEVDKMFLEKAESLGKRVAGLARKMK